ncbi:MAG: Hint domain-containing protein [Sphingomonadales bacterium]|nr:Hint domain-containing protein [Sphingomonadales bacterium]
MTIADQRLTSADGVVASGQISPACFREDGADAPRELRLSYTGYEQSEGAVSARDGEGVPLFAADLRHFAQAVPCFTPNSEIATGSGLCAVADLRIGQRVITRDSGAQSIRWIGWRRFGWRALALNPFLRPVHIARGALGNDLPERDMIVSPNHRFLTAMPGEGEGGERLSAARDLVGLDGVTISTQTNVDYVQILCDRHELLLGDGCWSESYQPTAVSLAVQPDFARAELAEILGAEAVVSAATAAQVSAAEGTDWSAPSYQTVRPSAPAAA